LAKKETTPAQQNLLAQIDKKTLPKHIAIIMDGNGRWARSQGIANRVFGHRNAIKAVREATEACAELQIKYLTLYAFSTENWKRPKAEVEALMQLMVHTIREELPTLMKNNVRLQSIGNTESLPKTTKQELKEAVEATKINTGLNLVLALSYSGKWDIVHACKSITDAVVKGHVKLQDVDEDLFSRYLGSHFLPDADLMIRTGGEFRISNFLLWQLAYAELHIFNDLFWPDFRRNHLYEAILSYQNRERRFGATGDQVKKSK
jgi:undecaprenyl diphosphate synthase